jgi:hypothetical protein
MFAKLGFALCCVSLPLVEIGRAADGAERAIPKFQSALLMKMSMEEFAKDRQTRTSFRAPLSSRSAYATRRRRHISARMLAKLRRSDTAEPQLIIGASPWKPTSPFISAIRRVLGSADRTKTRTGCCGSTSLTEPIWRRAPKPSSTAWHVNSRSGHGKRWASKPRQSDLTNVLRRPVEPAGKFGHVPVVRFYGRERSLFGRVTRRLGFLDVSYCNELECSEIATDVGISRATPSAVSEDSSELMGCPISRSFLTCCVRLELAGAGASTMAEYQRVRANFVIARGIAAEILQWR